ncbi:hypothetical protein Tco_0326815 [Tanacetum coccineum]
MFVNHLQPEWSKFVRDVKLAIDMHNSNFDQMYAYLMQHEAHVNEVRMMRQRFPDPLALQQQFYSPPFHQETYQAPVVHQQAYEAPVVHHQSPIVFSQLDLDLVPKFLPTDDPIESLNKAMAFLSTANTLRHAQTKNQLRTSYNTRNQATIQDDDLDAFDSYCDEAPTTSAVFMANLSTYDSDVLSEITSDSNVISYDRYLKENENEIVKSTTSPEQHDAMIMFVIDEMSSQVAKCNAANMKNKIKNESLTIELKRYKEMVKFFDERQKFELTDKEKHIDS